MNIEDIRAYCHTLAGTTESVKWENDLCFCIAEKLYAVVGLSGENRISFKTSNEGYEQLIASPGFESAPYLGRYKWVQASNFENLPEKQLKSLISESYQLIKSKLPMSKQRELEA